MSDCDHLNPATFIHRDGRAYCRGCRKFLGRVVPPTKKATAGRVPTVKERARQLSLEVSLEEETYGEAENEEA